jgi:cytochrome c
MKKILAHLMQLLLIACLPGAVSAADADGATLVQERRCYGCHHLTQTLIGPAYTAIAARHTGNKPIMEKALARKIVDGGAGNWGVVPMVPNEQVSEAEARVVARWILNLK